MKIKNIAFIIIIVVLLILIVQNLNIIPIDILLWQFEISLLLIIILPFILGIIVGWLLKTNRYRRKKQNL